MKITKAKRKDLEQIAKLMRRELSKEPFNEKTSLKNVLKSLEFYYKHTNIYVAKEGQEIKGVVIFKTEQYWEGKVLIIEDIVGLRTSTRKDREGINKIEGELLEWVENHARENNASYIVFSTNKKSKSIKELKKEGYQVEKNTILMRKKIK